MSEKELNSYRFSPEQEPTDEMLQQIMKEVAEEARTSNQQAAEAYMERMRQNARAKQTKWAGKIESVLLFKPTHHSNGVDSQR